MVPSAFGVPASIVSCVLALAPLAGAQQRQRSPLDGRAWGVVYDVTATKDVVAKKDIPYHRAGDRELRIDVTIRWPTQR